MECPIEIKGEISSEQLSQMFNDKYLEIFDKEEMPAPMLELNECRSYKTDGEHIHVKAVVDSGASESVAPPEMCPAYPIKESPGSRAGIGYRSAGKGRIANEGEQILNVLMEDGTPANVKYQIAQIRRPLNSVSEICDGGNQVIFGRGGGLIYNIQSGRQTFFRREGGIYTMEFWVKPPSNAPFQGQG